MLLSDDKTVETSDKLETFDYDDFLGIKLKLVNASDYYVYDNEFSVWKDKSDNDKYIENLVKDGEDLEVVGVVQPKDCEDSYHADCGCQLSGITGEIM